MHAPGGAAQRYGAAPCHRDSGLLPSPADPFLLTVGHLHDLLLTYRDLGSLEDIIRVVHVRHGRPVMLHACMHNLRN